MICIVVAIIVLVLIDHLIILYRRSGESRNREAVFKEMDNIALPKLHCITSIVKIMDIHLIQYNGEQIMKLNEQYECGLCRITLRNKRIIVFPKSVVCYECWSRFRHLYKLWHIKWALPTIPIDVIYGIQHLFLEAIKFNFIS